MIRGNKLVTLLLFLNVEDLIFDIQQSLYLVDTDVVIDVLSESLSNEKGEVQK